VLAASQMRGLRARSPRNACDKIANTQSQGVKF
jgi:hypothetical protein